MGRVVRAAMRSLARFALALGLVAGLTLLAVPGTATAQEDQASTFSWECQQLRCFFEVEQAPPGIEGNITEVEWSFGSEGENATGNPVRYTFAQPGTYNVSVVVHGEGNDTAGVSASQQVQVSSGQVPWSALGFGAAALVGSVVLARAT